MLKTKLAIKSWFEKISTFHCFEYILSYLQTLQWRHDEHDGISNHQPHDCLLKRLLMHRSKKTSKLCITSLCEGNSPVTGEFPAQRASNAENVSIWWCHHEDLLYSLKVVDMICGLLRCALVNFTHILQGGFTGTGAIVWLPQCQWSNLEGYQYMHHMNPWELII